VRVYTWEEDKQGFAPKDALGMDNPEKFLQCYGSVNDSPYAKHLVDTALTNPRARKYDFNAPEFQEFGPDPHNEKLDKPDDLPWAVVPLVIAGRLYGRIAVDNAHTQREITEDSLKYLDLFAALAAEAIANAQTIEMERASKLSAEYLATTIGHEIKNISQALGVLLGDLRDEQLHEDTQRDLEEAIEMVRAMNVASRSLLEFTTKLPRGIAPHSIRELVKLALNSVQAYLGLHDIKTKESWKGDPVVDVNPHMMVVAFVSIIRNAIDAMRGKERVLSISVCQTNSHVEVIFEDTGRGLTEEALHRCFDKGFSTKGEGNNGLGLWMVKQIVSEHNGEVTAANRPKRGARFVISLPVVKQRGGNG
jgi:signal transduction histidine kinase